MPDLRLVHGGIPHESSAAPVSNRHPSTVEGLQLFKAFSGIEDAKLRRSVIHLAELLATSDRR
jgi:hypothetical protein